jgi:hypothetical protein
MNSSRGLREKVVRALAKVGLVWAVAVLGALFMTMSAQGQRDDGPVLSAAATGAHSTSLSIPSVDAPRTAGLALALVLLSGGVTVLALGAARGDRNERDVQLRYAAEPDVVSDLPLALGVSVLAA